MKHKLNAILIVVGLLLCSQCICAANLDANYFIYPEYSKTISMDFRSAPLRDVLKIFSQQSGMNFIASEGVVDKKITLYLDKVPVESALERILTANSLAYEIKPDSNIFVVKTLSRPEKELLTRVYKLRHATVQSSKLNKTITEGESVGSKSSEEEGGTEEGTGLMAALQTVLSSDGKIIEDPRTNALIITDIPSQFSLIERTIAKLDVPIPQVLIEVEMLDVSKTATEQLGVQTTADILSFSGATRDHYYPWNQNKLNRDGVTVPKEYSAGTISAASFSATLEALKARTDTKYLARPRILTLNNETAEIKISTDEAIGYNDSTGSSEGVAVTTSSVERTETGVFLTVTPQANLITNDITMAIIPKVIQARAGMSVSGIQFKDPEERGSRSILRVHNSDTIMIGGLLRTDYSKTSTKVPFLGDIPILGLPFRHKNLSDVERELVIFITPHIVANTLSEELAYRRPQNIIREQGVLPTRLKKINDALSAVERRR